LDPNCAPWDFGIRRKEFQKLAFDSDWDISEVSSVEAVLVPNSGINFGLTPTTSESKNLSITIIGLGNGQFQVTTLCRGNASMQLHIDTWILLVKGVWQPQSI